LLGFGAGLRFLHLGEQLRHLLGGPQLASAQEGSRGGLVLALAEEPLRLLDQPGVLGLIAGLLLLAAGQFLGFAAFAFLLDALAHLGQLGLVLLALLGLALGLFGGSAGAGGFLDLGLRLGQLARGHGIVRLQSECALQELHGLGRIALLERRLSLG